MQPVPTRAVMLRQVRDRLAAGGVDEPEADARALLLEATGLAPLDLITGAGDALDEEAAARLEGLVVRRLAGEPVGRIRGQRLFWGLPIRLSVGTLEPRHDSEALIEEALLRFKTRRGEALRVLDLGTGSGCLLLALLSEWPMARGLGIDLSDDAVRTASANAALNGLDGRSVFRTGSWTTAVSKAESRAGFDLVISNPPYIPAGEIAALAPEVRSHDPRLALDGGPDGLNAYRVIIPALAGLIAPGGGAVLEIGAGQEGDVSALAREAGFSRISTRRDLGGRVRAIGLWTS
ncbi:MAG: peptide chain release factor N(5)-glutamine methyltransferase [Bosea sp. (in: a-proteobacteria)]